MSDEPRKDGEMTDEERAERDARYHNDLYPERECDYCGRLYRGPALYCSFYCAVTDAGG